MLQPPALAFDPKADFAAWKRKVRRKLREVLAFPDAPTVSPRLISEKRRDGYRLQQWELYPEPKCVVPFLMLVPDKLPAPAVMCFPGSDHPKEMLCGEKWRGIWENKWGDRQFMALQLVRAGYVAVAMDNPGTADMHHPSFTSGWRRNSEQLIWLGRSYEGLSTFQKYVALQWVKRLPFVTEVATCGHSLGAKPALLLGLLDPAVRAVVWNDTAVDWRGRDVATNLTPVGMWHYIPSFIRWFDYSDLWAALAPTPLLITEGGQLSVHAKIRRAYRQAGVPGNLKITFMPNFQKASRQVRAQPPEGITLKQFARYGNYDEAHYFKGEIAVPWLCRMLGR